MSIIFCGINNMLIWFGGAGPAHHSQADQLGSQCWEGSLWGGVARPVAG